MIVTEINLENFRNYASCTLRPDPGLNILYGNNGQGKTNVIEAVYMCSCARSHRTAKDAELIKHDEDYYSVDLHYQSSFNGNPQNSYEEQIGIKYKKLQTFDNKTKRYERILTKDNLQLERTADFVGLFHAVMFAPEDLQLVKDGPSVRRRFLDLLISQISPAYFRNLQIFARLLRQRNSLLKQIRDSSSMNAAAFKQQLVIWDEQFAKYAAHIIAERMRIVDELSDLAAEMQDEISDGSEKLRLVYRTVSQISREDDLSSVAQRIYERLESGREDDIFRGNTNTGPHRDDFEFLVNDLPLKSFGSQGQQRTAVLSIKMAELEIIRRSTKEAPVLLLDDVMSELDLKRRGRLLNGLENVQIFVTCTDPEQPAKNYFAEETQKQARYFYVEAGSLRQVN